MDTSRPNSGYNTENLCHEDTKISEITDRLPFTKYHFLQKHWRPRSGNGNPREAFPVMTESNTTGSDGHMQISQTSIGMVS